jgi:hypothetical protein
VRVSAGETLAFSMDNQTHQILGDVEPDVVRPVQFQNLT